MVAEVFTSGEERVVLIERSNANVRIFVNAANCEGLVNTCHKIDVVEENFGIVGLILAGECGKFIIGKREVHARDDLFKLLASDTALAEFIKVNEELFNSDALHDNNRSDSVLDVCGVI